jgi:hypothetical protein
MDWLDSHARKDLTIGAAQEDPTQAPIFALSPSSSRSSTIDTGILSGNLLVSNMSGSGHWPMLILVGELERLLQDAANRLYIIWTRRYSASTNLIV